MARSAAFTRIHREVMTIVGKLPPGSVTTYAAIGAYLDVVPRQVAFLLARRGDPAREVVPWWRVVGVDGVLGREKRAADGRPQAQLLEAEGIPVRDGRVELEQARLFKLTQRSTGVTATRRAAPSAHREG